MAGFEYLNLDEFPPRTCVAFIQGDETLGIVEVKEFFNSGEVPSSALLTEAVKYWNEQPQNIKDGVRAAIVVVFGNND